MTVPEGPAPAFPFRIGRLSRIPLLLIGVTRSRAVARVQADAVEWQFGFVAGRVQLGDIARWDITGPYRWIRSIGIRHTLFRNDISFCGSDHGAVRLTLRTRRRVAWINADEVYLGVDDLTGLSAALRTRGIEGEDLRRDRV
jgi:hypothetical protein